MSLYKEFSDKLEENNIADLISSITGRGPCDGTGPRPGGKGLGPCGQGQGPIQPDSNIGQFGAAPQAETIEIEETEDGSVKIKTSGICVNLSKCAILALKQYFQIKEKSDE